MINEIKKVPCLITVRTTSTRLPEKCLLPFGNCNVLEHVVRRVKSAGFRAILCTSINKEDDIIERIANSEMVEIFRGSEVDKLRRWRDCCRKLKIESFHSVDADDPFFSVEMIKYSFGLLENGYDIVEPSAESAAGNASVGYSIRSKVLEKACDNVEPETDTEIIGGYIGKLENINSIVLPANEQCSVVKARLTLDYEEDYYLLKSIKSILGENTSRSEVDKLLERNPDLYKINWFRNLEWKHRQLEKLQVSNYEQLET